MLYLRVQALCLSGFPVLLTCINATHPSSCAGVAEHELPSVRHCEAGHASSAAASTTGRHWAAYIISANIWFEIPAGPDKNGAAWSMHHAPKGKSWKPGVSE